MFLEFTQDEQYQIARMYADKFRAWRDGRGTAWGLKEAIHFWWIQKGPSHYTLEDGRALKRIMLELLRSE